MNSKINKLNNDKIKAMKSVTEEEECNFYARIPVKLDLKLKRYLLDKGGMYKKDWLISVIGEL